MIRIRWFRLFYPKPSMPTSAALLAALLSLPYQQSAAQSTASAGDDNSLTRLTALENELTALESEIVRLEDVKAIQRLQRAYGYYVDKKLSDEIALLFAEDASVELGGLGVYLGRARIGEFYNWVMDGPLDQGQLHNHMILQGYVTVEPDASTAQGRWRALIQTGQHGESATWAEGPYENEYVKEDGTWKFSRVRWFQTVAAPYSPGWHKDALPLASPSTELPPDRPPTTQYDSYPGVYLPPYHYANPVTGLPSEASGE